MGIVDDPVGAAHAATTPHQAAHTAARIEHEVSNSDNTHPEEFYDKAQDALIHLHDTFPGFHKLDAYKDAPASSPATRKAMRAQDGGGSASSGQSSTRTPAAPRPTARPAPRRRRGGGFALPRSSGVQSAGNLGREAAGVLIGLSVIYLLLSPRGSGAFSTLLSGIGSALSIFISPTGDPLKGHQAPSGAANATGPVVPYRGTVGAAGLLHGNFPAPRAHAPSPAGPGGPSLLAGRPVLVPRKLVYP